MKQDKEPQDVISDFIRDFFRDRESFTDKSALSMADDQKISDLKNIGIPKTGRELELVVKEMMENVYPYGLQVNHPRSFALIPSPASVVSWIGDIMSTGYNLLGTSWTTSPGASCIENELINWLCKQIGYPDTSSGLFVSGGSMSILTALVAARDATLNDDDRNLGIVYISDQTHYSVEKALRIIGYHSSRIRKIPTNSAFQMNIYKLRDAIDKDLANGLIPSIVIATAGTTNTGSIDPLMDIARLCNKYDVWMHVDGSYGASISLSKNYKYLLCGIEHADSISWDAHKWLFQTYACGIVLVKDKTNLLNSFHNHPEYLRDIDDDKINYHDMGIELSRPTRGLKLWITLQFMGYEKIGSLIDYGINLAIMAEDEILHYEDWEIVSHAQLAILTFRFVPTGISEKDLNEINIKISKSIVEDGYAAVFTTELNGKIVLRMCTINPNTTENDINSTINLLDEYANHHLSTYKK